MNSIDITTKDDLVISTPKDFSLLTPYVLFEQSDWHKPEIQFVRDFIQPGMHYLEVGASFGVYTLPVTKKVGAQGKVVAFEFDIIARNYLELSKKKNAFDQIEVVRSVVSDSEEEIYWQQNEVPELSCIHPKVGDAVKATTVDTWCLQNHYESLDFIKITTNGSEHLVLKGASNAIEKSKPALLISFNSENVDELNEILDKLGYRAFEYVPKGGVLVPFATNNYQPEGIIIAVHESNVNDLSKAGWMLNEALQFDAPDKDLWKTKFQSLNWASTMMFSWEYLADSLEHEAYFTALNYLIVSEQISISDCNDPKARNRKTHYLIEAAHRLIELYNAGNESVSVVFTLTRTLLSLGKRDQAAEIMQKCIDQTAFGKQNMHTPLPFLMPIASHEELPVKTDYSKWLMIRTIEAWLFVKNESMFFADEQDLKVIAILQGNPEISSKLAAIHKVIALGESEKKAELSKSMVFITHDYPPFDEGRVGHSIRAYTLTNFFAENGYNVYLIILANMVADREAPTMHPKVQIINPLFHEQRKTKADLSIREFCANFMSSYNVPTLVTSSPPLSSHIIAHDVKEKLGDSITWISDFRDFVHIHPQIKRNTAEGLQQQKEDELKVMLKSDAVITISTGMTKIAQDLHAELGATFFGDNYHLIENGFIEQPKVEVEPEVAAFAAAAKKAGKTILYYAGTGSVVGLQRFEGVYKDLTFIFDVFEKNPEIAKQFALIIQGKVQVFEEYMSKLDTKLDFKFFEPVDNAQMQANLEVADVGLSVNSDIIATPYIMGGKLYDYANAGLVLLLIYPENADSLKEFSAQNGDKCYFANVFDPESVKEVLSQIIMEKSQLHERVFSKEEVKPFSRNEQYKKFLPLIEKTNSPKNKFIHFCYNSIYAQTLADLLETVNKYSDQKHTLYVEKQQTIQYFNVDFSNHKHAHLFDKEVDGGRLSEIISHASVAGIFMHGLFRPWQYNIVQKIGAHKHIAWVIWGGDLYNPIRNNQVNGFPSDKISSIHTPVEGDSKLFKEHFGDKASYYFAYPYPGLYGNISMETSIKKEKQIIVGNSGDRSNNHIEILKVLSTKTDIKEYKLILPVAYNLSSEYKAEINSAINELNLQDNVEFFDSFLSPEEYLNFVGRAEIQIMAHNRQQAIGNTLMGIYSGSKVFIKKQIMVQNETLQNPTWHFLESNDLKINSFEQLSEYVSISDIPDIDADLTRKNQQIIKECFGLKTRAQHVIESCNAILSTKDEIVSKAIPV